MPRWVRFLSCSLTGLLVSLTGFLLTAWWWEGGPRYWAQVMDFIPTGAFLGLVTLFGVVVVVTLVLARLMVGVYDLGGAFAGLLSGLLVALAYAVFLVSSHLENWGGLLLGVRKAWPDAAVFGLPFAFAGAVVTWLWDRLD